MYPLGLEPVASGGWTLISFPSWSQLGLAYELSFSSPRCRVWLMGVEVKERSRPEISRRLLRKIRPFFFRTMARSELQSRWIFAEGRRIVADLCAVHNLSSLVGGVDCDSSA